MSPMALCELHFVSPTLHWRAGWTLFNHMFVRDMAGAASFAAGVPMRAVRRAGLRLWRLLGRDSREAAGQFLIGSVEM